MTPSRGNRFFGAAGARAGTAAKVTLAVVVAGTALFFWVGADIERFVNRVEPVVLPGV